MAMSKSELKEQAAKAGLALAREKAWKHVSLTDVAEKAGLPLSEFYDRLDLDGVLAAIETQFDKACGSEPVSKDETARERIFDVAMLRFEAMEDHRDSVLAIRKYWKKRPVERLKAAGRRVKSARWILTCAGLDNSLLEARSVILSGILFRAEDAWEKETSPDFTRTMAQLDRDLRDLEDWGERLSGFGKKRTEKDQEAAGEHAAS